jgi:signal transduction histidine kinase
VRDAERRRIGADLHDNLGQHLTGVACLAAALREQLKRAGSPLAAQAEQLAQSIAAMTAVVREVSHGLCPSPVARQGLPAALADLGESVQRRHAIRCTFEEERGLRRASREAAVQVYCIAQEAITNAIRHGRARRIAMRLAGMGAHLLRLVIEDDGTGFDPSTPASSGGLGRHLMAHRAALIGGRLRILPLRHGMQVECLFPSGSPTHAAQT